MGYILERFLDQCVARTSVFISRGDIRFKRNEISHPRMAHLLGNTPPQSKQISLATGGNAPILGNTPPTESQSQGDKSRLNENLSNKIIA